MGQRSVDGGLRSHAGCHFGAPIGLWSLLEDFAPEIPDFALDMHTMKGKELCRGLDHFRKEGAKLVPEPTADPLRGRSLQALGDQAAGHVNPASRRISLIFVCAVF
jgi:hypothetical protein